MARPVRHAIFSGAAILLTCAATGCAEERGSAADQPRGLGVESTKDWSFSPPSLDVQRILIELDRLYLSRRMEAVLYCPENLAMAPESTFLLLVTSSEDRMLTLEEIDERYRRFVTVKQVEPFKFLNRPEGDVDEKQCDDGKYDTLNPIRPVPIGVSAGLYGEFPGTLGCRVHDGKRIYALSNAHVFKPPGANGRIDYEILQPGWRKGQGEIKWTEECLGRNTIYPHTIALRTRDLPIHWLPSKLTNRIDAAIGETGEDCIKNEIPEAGDGYTTPSSVVMTWEQVREVLQDGRKLAVQKRGQTTCLRSGELRCIGRQVRVTDNGTKWEADFVNQWIIEGAFAEPGDSGSLVVTKNSGVHNPKPVGLLFAHTGVYFAANPIDQVLCCLGVAIDGAERPRPPDPATCECTHPIEGTEPGTWEDWVAPGTAKRLKETVARQREWLPEIDGAVSVEVRPDPCSRGPCILVVIEEKDDEIDPRRIPKSVDGFPVVPILKAFEILPGDL